MSTDKSPRGTDLEAAFPHVAELEKRLREADIDISDVPQRPGTSRRELLAALGVGAVGGAGLLNATRPARAGTSQSGTVGTDANPLDFEGEDLDLQQQSATPSGPGTSQVRVYAKTDGNVYKKPAGGTESQLGSGGAFTDGDNDGVYTLPTASDGIKVGSVDSAIKDDKGAVWANWWLDEQGATDILDALQQAATHVANNSLRTSIYIDPTQTYSAGTTCTIPNVDNTYIGTPDPSYQAYIEYTGTGDAITFANGTNNSAVELGGISLDDPDGNAGAGIRIRNTYRFKLNRVRITSGFSPGIDADGENDHMVFDHVHSRQTAGDGIVVESANDDVGTNPNSVVIGFRNVQVIDAGGEGLVLNAAGNGLRTLYFQGLNVGRSANVGIWMRGVENTIFTNPSLEGNNSGGAQTVLVDDDTALKKSDGIIFDAPYLNPHSTKPSRSIDVANGERVVIRKPYAVQAYGVEDIRFQSKAANCSVDDVTNLPGGYFAASGNGHTVGGVGEESGTAATPTAATWKAGDFVDYTDTDGTDDGVYLLLLDGTWSQVGST